MEPLEKRTRPLRKSRKREAESKPLKSAVSRYFARSSTSFSQAEEQQNAIFKKNLQIFTAGAKTGQHCENIGARCATVTYPQIRPAGKAEPPPICLPGAVNLSAVASTSKNFDCVARDNRIQDETTDVAQITPLEQQFLDLKARHPDVLLLIEAGYLFRMFDEDAMVAHKELKFCTSLGHRLLRTSFPSSTLHVHLRTLVSRGYKVGVVRKSESTLDRSRGPGRHDIFGRELTALYTRSTMLGEDVNPIKLATDVECRGIRLDGGAAANYLMCLYEIGGDCETRIGLLATCLESSDIVYDEFRDDDRRSQLENRLALIRPVEILIPLGCMTPETERTIEAARQSSPFGECIRIERMADHHFKLNHARDTLRGFYGAHEKQTNDSELPIYCDSWVKVVDLPPLVVCCLGATFSFLCNFKLESVLKLVGQAKHVSEDGAVGYMEMDARTVMTLELFQSRSRGQSDGSFVHAFDRTSTAFGARLLQSWINRPLRTADDINNRLDVVDSLVNDSSTLLEDIRRFLSKLPDLERGIATIFHRKCSTHLYWKVVTRFVRVRNFLLNYGWHVLPLPIQSIMNTTAALLTNCDELLQNLNPEACKLGQKTKLFVDVAPYPEVASTMSEIFATEESLFNLRPAIAHALHIEDFQFSVFNGYEFVILVNSSSIHAIPPSWITVFGTKSKTCYRTPEMDQLVKDLAMLKDHLKYQCHQVWLDYLENFKSHYHKLRHVVQNLATLDCLTMFATFAKSNGLSKPLVTDSNAPQLQIQKGYHFTLQSMLGFDRSIVANDTDLSVSATSCMLISGTNMGGKSTYINQVGLIVIMAQIGSFVPAASVKMTPFSSICARSRPSDSLVEGKSTFYVEMESATRMLKRARHDSLLLLDELGCGTCDVDGAAITEGLLWYILTEIKCLLLCVTQFADVKNLESLYENVVVNYHLAVHIDDTDVAYLYELRRGARSEWLARHVAKRAGLDDKILTRAASVSRDVERSAIGKTLFKEMMLTSQNKFYSQGAKIIDEIDCCIQFNNCV